MTSNNPLYQYLPGQNGPVDPNSLVANGVYGVQGVLDTIGRTNPVYYDPATNQVINSPILQVPLQSKSTVWYSSILIDDTQTDAALAFSFDGTSYINQIQFDLLSVPCTWSLYLNNESDATTIGQGIIQQYDTESFSHIELQLVNTICITAQDILTLRIVKSTTGTQYSTAVKNFTVRLKVTSYDDLTAITDLETSTTTEIAQITTQNALGFSETYTPQTYGIENLLDSSSTTFWKCSPQPVGDAVVYFVVSLEQDNLYPLSGTAVDTLSTTSPILYGGSISCAPDPEGGTGSYGYSSYKFDLTKTYSIVSFWYKTSTTGAAVLLDTRTTGSNSGFYVDITSTNKLRAVCNTTSTTSISGTSTVTDGQWHNAVLEFNNGMMSLYHDGQIVGSGAFTVPPTINTLTYVGRRSYSNTNYLTGNMSNIVIYESRGEGTVSQESALGTSITSQLVSLYAASGLTSSYYQSIQDLGPKVYYQTSDSSAPGFDSALDPYRVTTVNRMFIDPLYTNNSMNLYYSYDSNYWYPVQRDFKLRKGIYELPTIAARYLKFEFTQLTPEPYKLISDVVQREVEVFPDWVDEYFTNLERAIPDIANKTYAQSSYVQPSVGYNTGIDTLNVYGSAAKNINTSQFGAEPSISNAQSTNSYITDPTISYKSLQSVGDVGSTYRPVTDISFFTRRFYQSGTHEYKNITIPQTWHQSYFTGIKSLSLFNINYENKLDYPDFTDYLLSSGTNTIISGNVTSSGAIFRPPTVYTYSGSTIMVSGGYSGVAGQSITTKSLQSLTNFDSFKIAMLSSDWSPFLSNAQTTLQANTLSELGISTSGVLSSSVVGSNVNFNIFEIVPSGSPTLDWIQSDSAGSNNLLTSTQANFTLGGTTSWTRSGTTWTNYSLVGSGNVATSGVYPVPSYSQWGSYLASSPYGNNALSVSPVLGPRISNTYTFMVNASGTGTVTSTVTYTGSLLASGQTNTFSQTFSVSGTQNLIIYTTQPNGGSTANFKVTASGTIALSNAGYFAGVNDTWSSPLYTSNMRISAVSRIYLPTTNQGTYRCTLYGYDVSGNQVELAHKQYNKIPVRTWVDLEVPFTLTSGNTNYNQFSVRLTQFNGNGESYRVALLGTFFNPVSLEYNFNNTWYPIIGGVNDPNALVTLPSGTNQLQLRATLAQDYADISAITIVPNYRQNPYYSSTPIQFLSDTKTNELGWRRAPVLKPLFQLNHELHPSQYDIRIMMNIDSPYYLD